MMNKIKNVIVINDFDYVQGGASKVAIETANLLADKGLNVIFFSAVSNNDNSNNKVANVKYISTNQCEALKEKNKLKGMIQGIYNFKAKKELKKILSLYSKDDTVIHIHGWTKALSSSIFSIAFKMEFKVYLTLHDYFTACPNGGYFNYPSNKICNLNPMHFKCICTNCDSRNYMFKLYRILRQFVQNNVVKLNKKIKYVIGISNFSVKILKETLNENVKIKIIHNPIELIESNKNNIKSNKYYTYIGRISKEKGICLLCESLSNYNNTLVIGDGPELEKLKIKYKNINFTGWKDKNEIEKYLTETRILILPSLWYEGAPLVPIEAMNFGVPCIISKYCAAKEYIKNNNGLLYDPYIKGDLEEKIQKMESNIDEYSSNSLVYIENLKKENYVKELISYFEE